ncbi:MAG: sulfatase-like hydrolase/transferase, partial [Bacillota bacterium]|nr:sulfatase-like hydrolase/transferase [Bacillota bacterium]
MNLNQKPNIIYILADDLGYGDVSCLNERAAFQTPYLDALYKNGMAFTDAHATSAVCTPSRYSILTGRYNWRSRLKKGVLGGFSPALIEKGRMTVAQYLRQNGYKTAAVGKWHLGMNFAKRSSFAEAEGFEQSEGVAYDQPISCSPIDYGFDYFFGISASLDMPPYAYLENDRFTQIPAHWTAGEGKGFYRRGLTAAGFDHETVLDVFTEKVCTKIGELK